MTLDTPTEPLVHDQVHVESSIDGARIDIRAVVVNVQPQSIWMGLPQPDAQLERFGPDVALHLTFKRDNAAIVADSVFQSHLGSSKSRLFAVAMPQRLELVQRRAHIRLPAECPVSFEVAPAPGDVEQTSGTGTTRNISAGGVCFSTAAGVAVGAEVALRVDLGAEGVVNAAAEVVRVEDAPAVLSGATPGGRPSPVRRERLVAVRFLEISEIDQDRIVRRIFAAQRARREEAQKPA